MSEPAPVKSVHIGTCHCQAIRFTVNVPPLTDNGRCDCSHCSKRGIVWGFCEPEDWKIERGADLLKPYEFGAKTFKHFSCGVCGTNIASGKTVDSLVNPKGTIGYNVTALRDIDPHKIPYTKYSGVDRVPAYVPAEPIEHPFKDIEGQVVLHGSCHCHAIRFAVQTPPLGILKDGHKPRVINCNCSICAGNGVVWMYPKHAEYYFPPEAKDHLVDYSFAPISPRQNHFYFCKTCGCTIYERRNVNETIGLNIRLIDGLDLETAGVENGDALSREPLYTIREE